MTRSFFDRELDELKRDMITMGGLVEEAIKNTMTALKNQDEALARKVFRDDDVVDDYEKKIERRCLELIARQQPLAKDLRTISTALKMITDMERIGDHAADIAEITLRMVNETYAQPLIDIPNMANLASGMVKKAIDAYIRQDIELAQEVCSADDAVDELFVKIILDLIELMKHNPRVIEQATNFMFIAKYLERMADHATNIGEWVFYNVTGEHEHLARNLHKDDRIRNPFVSHEE